MRSRISILLSLFSALCAALIAGVSVNASQDALGNRITQAHTHVHLHMHSGVGHTYSHAHTHNAAQQTNRSDERTLQSVRPLGDHEHEHCTDCRHHHAPPLTLAGINAPRKAGKSPAPIAPSLSPSMRENRADRVLPDLIGVDPARHSIGLRTIVLQT